MPTLFTRARNANGEIQRIPRAWLAEGSPFASQFTQTPSAQQEEDRSSTPDGSWTVPQLRHHAEQVGVDLTGATTKADILSAIQERASATDPQEG